MQFSLRKEKSLIQLLDGIVLLPQVLLNIRTENARSLIEAKPVKKIVSDVTRQLENKGRILLRASGTESVLRIMVEGEDQTQVSYYAEQLRSEILHVEKGF